MLYDPSYIMVLDYWREKSASNYPDVIRMTGPIGVSSQTKENLIRTVNPQGGIILLSEQNSFNRYQTTVWQVFREEDDIVRMKLLYGSDYYSGT